MNDAWFGNFVGKLAGRFLPVWCVKRVGNRADGVERSLQSLSHLLLYFEIKMQELEILP
ncbi:MAG: hypothetical protein KGJ57_22620 [Sphingomonadales bacterium]|nr:hypothetical protein [Sphingomonadales bacterium]MDE2172180.1 hypothetical protein [Sphingomonadales bacterium]